ncbi:MAG: S46 family peptidase [Bacteroidales bacterium]|nr:S46 family peptidase [Bacteroidales bacterium]
MKKILLLTALMMVRFFAVADEGMWIPLFLGYNEAEMQQMGFHLTADDVYSVNHHSMKDGIVLFGGGCTGELISPDGLLITNHHCGYSYVQAHSSMEHNYLHNGFWSKNRDEELVTQGLTVTFLVYMEDVTTKVLEGVTDGMSESERNSKIKKNINAIENEAIEGTHYTAKIKPFYYGNQYFLFVNEVFEDVRLVGVPPESIGKFGGDTDNWMWPRHTGDFSLWRIYTDKDGNPAPYSPDNIPLKSKKYFPISIKGVNEGDFTLVFGYPGTTQQFLISDAVDIKANVQNPIAIHARDLRLAAMKRQMEKSTEIRLMYSAKSNSISNGWKKWIGESKGINECKVVEKKIAEEQEFMKWVNASPERQKQYGNLLSDMKKVYVDYKKQVKSFTFLSETFIGVELNRFLCTQVHWFASCCPSDVWTDEQFEKGKTELAEKARSFFSNYNVDIDSECFVELMYYYFSEQDPELIPENLHKYINMPKSEWQAFLDREKKKAPYLFDGEKMQERIQKAKRKDWVKFLDDELYQLVMTAYKAYAQSYYAMDDTEKQLDLYYRTYVKALMEKDTDKTFYPDANLTMRVTYGNVKGFEPNDGVRYTHYTTLAGVIAKDNPDIFDYKVDPKLKELFAKHDFGPYANEKGELPVCFIASNHTTGGNSGSPVIDADGNLIGINFDRVWQGTMSDINYDVNRCRNISLDVRYFLFIVDKFAGAQNIIDELDIR